MKGRQIRYSADELNWIPAFTDMPRRELHALFVQVWNRADVSFENFKALCTRKGWKTGRSGQFVKGVVAYPPAKGTNHPGSQATQFKKGHGRTGHAVTLYKPIGTERITPDGYLERKVNDGPNLKARWQAVHRLNWIAANGPIPPGHRLKCLDGNRLNTDPANWRAVPNALAPRLDGRFGRGFNTAPPELRPLILATTELEHAAREARKGHHG